MASHADDDLPEFTGATQKTKADPKGKPGAKPVAPKVAVYNPASPGDASHAKHARLGPAKRLDDAEASLNSANAELVLARAALRSAELLEGDALTAMLAALPPPTADQVNRERLAAIQAAKQSRADQGLNPAEPRAVSKIGHSPIDVAASQRPRTSTQAANAPLRSPVVRRGIA